MRNLLLFSEAIMDKRYPALENSRPLEPFIDRFAKELVQERIDSGQIAVKNMSFAEMKMLSHQIGRRVAQHLGHQMTSLQSELYSDDYCCPTCGLECEAIQKTRTIHSIDGPTEIVELKSYCPKCRCVVLPRAGSVSCALLGDRPLLPCS